MLKPALVLQVLSNNPSRFRKLLVGQVVPALAWAEFFQGEAVDADTLLPEPVARRYGLVLQGPIRIAEDVAVSAQAEAGT